MRRRVSTLPRDSRAAFEERELRQMRQKVQIAKKQLGLADEDYRAILARVTGKASSTQCGPSDLDALLKEFRRLGWKNAGRKPPSAKAQVRMIRAVFADLKPFLAVGDESTLRAFVRRQTKTPATPDGVDAPEFLDGVQANKVLEGLKAWLRRERERRRA
jgi:phage gp16-like protein